MSCRDARRAECRGRVHQEEISRHKGGQLEVIANGKGSSAMSIASSHAGAERSTTRCLKMTLGPSLTFANHSIFSHPLSSGHQWGGSHEEEEAHASPDHRQTQDR